MSGKLYLIPTVLAEGTENTVLPPSIRTTIQNLNYFLCENVRTARRFVSRLHVHSNLESLHFDLLDKDTSEDLLPTLMKPIRDGHDVGILSESGCPAVADPGARAVEYAHEHQIQVIPLSGPSSLILSLMASGLNGQQFAFHGYLPVDADEAATVIRMLEKESKEKNQTQIFIETPYRNNQRLTSLLKNLRDDTHLCVSINLTAPEEKIISMPVAAWRKQPLQLDKQPATFLFLAASKMR